jgi:hypothetical protein
LRNLETKLLYLVEHPVFHRNFPLFYQGRWNMILLRWFDFFTTDIRVIFKAIRKI